MYLVKYVHTWVAERTSFHDYLCEVTTVFQTGVYDSNYLSSDL